MSLGLISVMCGAFAVCVLASGTGSAAQRVRGVSLRHVHSAAVEDHPLTIGGQRGRGIYRRGNDIVAPGGFSAHGYGFPAATAEDRRAALNTRIRRLSTGLYGYGVDGLGGTGFEDDPEYGYNNPAYGNAYNRYVGFNGVPTALAFGPGFANRYVTDHDPTEDDDDRPGPSPEDLGYVGN